MREQGPSRTPSFGFRSPEVRSSDRIRPRHLTPRTDGGSAPTAISSIHSPKVLSPRRNDPIRRYGATVVQKRSLLDKSRFLLISSVIIFLLLLFSFSLRGFWRWTILFIAVFFFSLNVSGLMALLKRFLSVGFVEMSEEERIKAGLQMSPHVRTSNARQRVDDGRLDGSRRGISPSLSSSSSPDPWRSDSIAKRSTLHGPLSPAFDDVQRRLLMSASTTGDRPPRYSLTPFSPRIGGSFGHDDQFSPDISSRKRQSVGPRVPWDRTASYGIIGTDRSMRTSVGVIGMPVAKSRERDEESKMTGHRERVRSNLIALGLDRDIENLSDRMRQWVVHVFREVASEIRFLEKDITGYGLHYLSLNAPFSGSMVERRGVNELQYHLETRRERMEHVISWNNFPREYLLSRIKKLGERFVHEYRWDGGGLFKDRPWSRESDLPTDAELVCHVICCFLDDRLGTGDTRVFSNIHFKETHSHRGVAVGGPAIKQEEKYPPYFVVFSKGHKMDIERGKDNIFTSFVVLVHEIVEHLGGKVGGFRVDDERIGWRFMWDRKRHD
eukprot:TRINITY_DN1361_c0_g1_i1.p1 TRINITY_DN1361_c0_g1~~TRINITY_DN1361_c0_g1_i1.p1  ORF type:complete len:581 (+),score=142.23 TRINITY_DN1361_c0_g1_i1:86-1744(+)